MQGMRMYMEYTCIFSLLKVYQHLDIALKQCTEECPHLFKELCTNG